MKHKSRYTSPQPKPMKLVPAHAPVLHGVALASTPSERWDHLAKRLVATAVHNHGMAVAAPQVGINVRLVGLADGRVILNPELSNGHGRQVGAEGCLTYPGRWWSVERLLDVQVTGFDPGTGDIMSIDAHELDARMWQHEIDHLDGLVLDGRFREVFEGAPPGWSDPASDPLGDMIRYGKRRA